MIFLTGQKRIIIELFSHLSRTDPIWGYECSKGLDRHPNGSRWYHLCSVKSGTLG